MATEFQQDLLASTALTYASYIRSGLPRVATDGTGRVSPEGAWQGFLIWALGRPEMRKAYLDFTKEPISFHGLVSFAHWATLYHWGTDGVPENFLDEARRRFEHVDQDHE